MADMVKLPGVGSVPKPALIAGVGIVGGVVAYAYWRRSQAPPEIVAPAAVDTAATDTGSGFVEDSTAAGYNTVFPSAYSGDFSPYGYDIYGNPLPAPTGAGSGGIISNNNDWATAAESALESGGVTLAVSTAAVSRVLGGLTVTSDQRDLFLQAVGLLGQPPQGYPEPIKLVDTPANPTPPPPGKGGTLPAPTGLHVVGAEAFGITLNWQGVTGADYYRIYRAGAATNIGSSEGTTFRVSGLRPNTTYHFHVRAVGADGMYGAPSADVSARTKKS